jgi:hypothetical protein
MKRSLDWRRHPLLVAGLAAAGAVAALEVAGAVAAAAALLALVVLAVGRLGWWPAPRPTQTVCVEVPLSFDYEHGFDDVFRCCAQRAELVGVHSHGPCLELEHSVRLRRGRSPEGLLQDIRGVVDERRAVPGGS